MESIGGKGTKVELPNLADSSEQWPSIQRLLALTTITLVKIHCKICKAQLHRHRRQ